ncbi:conserved hypothetical protein [Burkholderia ambifaria IOP40-10]|uniref:Uncharacterized protein n=1 Tax=Burkholderia ambifaria IOP40-10 TaxID=396596 RepID=B1FL36_9BURK|nr:conserved hypothetical protein [Burkholderia ambifaria IOP40-10]
MIGASGPPLVPPVAPPSGPVTVERRPVSGASGLVAPPVLPVSRPPTDLTVLPVDETVLPRPVVTGLPPVEAISAPPWFRPLPSVPSSVLTGAPRPVAVPIVCVVWPTIVVIGVMAELTVCVTCWMGPVDSALDSVVPPFDTALPTCVTRPPTAPVTGASGDSGPLPRLVTRLPVCVTAPPSWLTTPPVLATVTPTGSFVAPSWPRPSPTPLPSAVTAPPTCWMMPPAACVVAGSTPGSDWFATVLPRFDTVPPRSVTRLPPFARRLPTGFADTPEVPLVPLDVPLVVPLVLPLVEPLVLPLVEPLVLPEVPPLVEPDVPPEVPPPDVEIESPPPELEPPLMPLLMEPEPPHAERESMAATVAATIVVRSMP